MSKHLIFSLLISFSFYGCVNNKKPEVVNGVYYWKSQPITDSASIEFLQEDEVQELYFKIFDIKLDRNTNQPIPVDVFTSLGLDSQLLKKFRFVPTVYIEQSAIKSTHFNHETHLKLYTKIQKVMQRLGVPMSEIQLDCDWTPATKKKFFACVKDFKKWGKEANFKVSATIRLHQLKYFIETGVPDLDYGVLMCYNMGDVIALNEENSIFNIKTFAQYISSDIEYPLPLKLAMPIFEWAPVYRNKKLTALVPDPSSLVLKDSARFEKEESFYRVKKSGFINGSYVYKGDLLKIEQVTLSEINEGILLAFRRIKSPINGLILFDLNEKSIKKHGKNNILKLYHTSHL